MKTIGVAILAYEGFNDLMRCVRSIKFNTKLPITLIVFDNSEKTTMIRNYIQKAHPDVMYLGTGKNVGCSQSRNLMLKHFLERAPDAEFLCIMDQDVTVKKGWLRSMVNTAAAHDNAGIVAWPLANRYRPVTNMGIVSEVASVCNLHRIESLLQAQEKWGGPWEERMFMHKFDSLICQRLNQLQWRTYLVLDLYKPSSAWCDQPALIEHHHPHTGVRRNSKWKKIFDNSKKLYAKLQRMEKWSEWLPPKPYLSYNGGRGR